MRKRIYFMISSVIQIIASVTSIVNAKELTQQLISSAEAFPEGIKERMIDVYQESGANMVIAFAVIVIILNAIILCLAYFDKIEKKKRLIIVLSIFSLLTTNLVFIELMAVINIIVAASIKVDATEKERIKKKKEIPVLEKEKIDKSKIIKAIILLLVFFSQFIWEGFLKDNIFAIIILIMFYILMITLCICFFFDTLKDSFNIFKKNFGSYMGYIFIRIAIFYIIFIVVSLICMAITNSFAENQKAIESLPIFISLPLAVIYAPIVEEILFRGSIRRFIRNDTIFIIVSGIIFGLLHTISSETSLLNVFVLAIPYGIMGSFLAYIYTKTNNICANISCHFFFNLFAMLITILL